MNLQTSLGESGRQVKFSMIRESAGYSHDSYLINKSFHHAPEILNSGHFNKFPQADKWNSCQLWERNMVAPLSKVFCKQFNSR